MRAFILLILIFFSMNAKSQTVEEKFRLALQLQADKEYGKSNKHLIDLYSTNDMKDLVCLNLAKNYLAIGNCKQAEKYASECIDLKSEYGKEAAIVKGTVLHQEGRVEEEEKLYIDMLSKYPNDYNINLYLAMLYSEKPDNSLTAGKQFYKTIKCNPVNRAAHFLASQYEQESRHYIQCLLADYFQLMISPNPQSVKKIQALLTRTRNVRDAMQDVIYNNDTTASETDIQLYWAMAFLSDLEKCDVVQESQLDDPECFIENTRNLIIKICESATCKETKDEWTHSDFYLDFFNKVLKNDLLDEFMYFSLIKSYPDIDDYIYGISKEKLTEFASFLDNYFN